MTPPIFDLFRPRKKFGPLIGLMESWINARHPGNDHTSRNYHGVVRWTSEWVKEHLGPEADLADLTPIVVHQMLEDRLRCHKATTALNWRNVFSVFCRDVATTHHGWVNPCPFVRAPITDAKKPHWHTVEEENAIRSVWVGDTPFKKIRNKLILELGMSCGLRRTEITALTVGQCIYGNRMLHNVRGKGRTFYDIPLPPDITELLNIYLPLREAELIAAAMISDPSMPLIISLSGVIAPDDDVRISGDRIYDIAQAYGKAAKVDNCHPHRWRHTAIRRCWEATKDIVTTKQFARHANVDITSHYCRADVNEVDVAVQLMAQARNKTR